MCVLSFRCCCWLCSFAVGFFRARTRSYVLLFSRRHNVSTLSCVFLFVSIFRAPLSVRGNNGSGGPGSEHSLPPSYNRTRNNLLRIPAIIGGSNGNIINNTSQSRNDNTTTNTSNSIIESKLSKSSTDIQDIDELFLNANNSTGSHNANESNAKSAELDTSAESHATTVDDDTKADRHDLVTIVTITGCTTTESSTGGEMNILAHL